MYLFLLSFRESNIEGDQIVPLTSEHSGNEILGHFPSTFGTGGSIHQFNMLDYHYELLRNT